MSPVVGHSSCLQFGTTVNKTAIRLMNKSSLVAQTVKSLPAVWEIWVQSLDGKIPWRRKQQPTPVLLPGEFHGQRNLEGYSPQCCKELDTTE